MSGTKMPVFTPASASGKDETRVVHRISIIEVQRVRCEQEYNKAWNLFVEFCLAHGLPHGSTPADIPSYRIKANRLRFGIASGAVLATFVFGILNGLSMEFASGAVVFSSSVVFGVLLGCFTSCVLSRWLRVDILDPESIRTADILLVASGVVALVSFVIFLALRFWQSSAARSSLPILATLFELGLAIALASALEILPCYSAVGEYAKNCVRAQRKIVVLEQRIAACRRYLTEEDDKNDQNNDHHDDTTGPRTPSSGDVPGKRSKPNGSAAGHTDLD